MRLANFTGTRSPLNELGMAPATDHRGRRVAALPYPVYHKWCGTGHAAVDLDRGTKFACPTLSQRRARGVSRLGPAEVRPYVLAYHSRESFLPMKAVINQQLAVGFVLALLLVLTIAGLSFAN